MSVLITALWACGSRYTDPSTARDEQPTKAMTSFSGQILRHEFSDIVSLSRAAIDNLRQYLQSTHPVPPLPPTAATVDGRMHVQGVLCSTFPSQQQDGSSQAHQHRQAFHDSRWGCG